MKYHETPLQVRFQEIDLYGMAWHGHYLNWFEVGRNDLAGRFGMGPLQLKDASLLAPVVELDSQFKVPAFSGDHLVIQTTMEKSEVAKLIFRYRVIRGEKGTVLATGSTTHVLTDMRGNLLYRIPKDIQQKIAAMQAYLEVP